MAVRLLIAPAGAGKTQACLDRVRTAARERPLGPIWACLPNAAQVRAFRRRLAANGGALGVEVGTFFDLYHETLRAAGQVYVELEDPLQHRLLRAVVDRAAAAGELAHYGPLRDKPGFVLALHRLVQELKQARVQPARLQEALRGQGPRLEELARLYASYQDWLHAEQWMDPEGLGWLATRALEGSPDLLAHWQLVVVDGFDQFNQAQVAFLAELARQAPQLWVTLTYSRGQARLAHRRFEQALGRLEAGLGVVAEALPAASGGVAPGLAHLEAALFEPVAQVVEPGDTVTFLEAPNRAAEVRAALRWVKERLVWDEFAPSDVAILARDVGPYAPFLDEAAEEFGLPLEVADGWPLALNPVVAALLGVLSLARRDRASASLADGRFPVRPLLEALRSPYLDWQHCLVGDGVVGLTPEDVDRLEEVAGAGQVLGGLEEWREALATAPAGGEPDDGPEIQATAQQTELLARFGRWVARVTPPAEDTVAGYTVFVEGLIGEDPRAEDGPGEQDSESLRVLAAVRGGPVALVGRDVGALRALKEVLRGLVWAEVALGDDQRVPYERFLDELQGAIAAGRYHPVGRGAGAVWAASVHAARGLSFRAVALLGLADGEFPRAPAIDPLLRAADRERLVALGLPLDPLPPGAEFSLFYEAVTRARERLLLVRPYLADDGQPWEPSPFWEEALGLVGGNDHQERRRLVRRVRSGDPLPPAQAASWPELAAALGQRQGAALPAVEGEVGALCQAARHGAAVLAARLARDPVGPHEGECGPLQAALAARYGPQRPWSASRLEVYLGCPFAYFLAHALELVERVEPQPGYGAAHLGTMYHEILERVYLQAPSEGLEGLLATLRKVAAEVLDGAPRRLGFRPSRLWEAERVRIQADLENTLRGLEGCSEGWQPLAFEARFGRPGDGAPAQPIACPEGEFLLRGVVDRVDRNAAGEVRLMDYKSSSETMAARDLLEGRKIQLALYAWAAQGVLGLGPVVEGFYWHLRQARASSLRLSGVEGGAAAAMEWAAEHAGRAIAGVREGAFKPSPAGKGCPAYCLGSGSCWRYAPR